MCLFGLQDYKNLIIFKIKQGIISDACALKVVSVDPEIRHFQNLN